MTTMHVMTQMRNHRRTRPLPTLWARCLLIGLVGAWAGFGATSVVSAEDLEHRLVDLQSLETTFVELADNVRPSVVSIRCYQVHGESGADAANRVRLPISQGSGFVIAADGFIATNYHVIEDADLISVVTHNGLQYIAEVVQIDRRIDLAVIRIDEKGLKPVRFGDLASVRVNQWAFACGNPFGLAFDNNGKTSVTYGVVSQLGRMMTNRLTNDSRSYYYGNLIETSATINPGSSGGPLFNIDGEVIGIVTAIETSSGVSEGHGFAIPIDRNTRDVLKMLKAGKVKHYGFLGIEVDNGEPPRSRRVADIGRSRGARISRIWPPDGPAAKAGLQANDLIVEFNGVPVEGRDHLVHVVQFAPVGADVELTYLRRSIKRKAVITLGDRSELLRANNE